MQRNFTPELLVKHLYNETTDQESELVENALKNNKELQQEFTRMQAAKLALDDADGHEPGKSVIASILDYSKKTATEMV